MEEELLCRGGTQADHAIVGPQGGCDGVADGRRAADGAEERPQGGRQNGLQLLVKGVVGDDALQRSCTSGHVR